MKTIAVSSGKGGVGKTTVAANMALALASIGRKTVLFDADLQLANADIVLGLKPEFTLEDVVNGERKIVDVAMPVAPNLSFVAGGSGVRTLMTAGPKKLGLFAAQLAELERTTDFLIYDTAAGLDGRVIAFMKMADEVLLVLTPEPTSVTDAYATLKVLLARKPEAVVRALVNMAENEADGYRVYEALAAAAKRYLGYEVPLLGVVREDPAVRKAAKSRKPLMLHEKGGAAHDDFLRVAKALGALKNWYRVA